MGPIPLVFHRSAGPARPPADRVRAASLTGFGSLVRELGGQPGVLLSGRGLGAVDLTDGEATVPYSAVIGVLEDAAGALRCPDFGLLLSRRQDIDVLGPAAMIMRYSETVGDALEAISTWLFVHTPAASIGLLEADGDDMLLTYEVLLPGLRGRRQITDLSLGLAQSHLEMLLGERFRASQVRLGYRRPASTAALGNRFGKALVFDSAVSGIGLPKAALLRPVPTANANYRRVVLDYLHNQRRERGKSGGWGPRARRSAGWSKTSAGLGLRTTWRTRMRPCPESPACSVTRTRVPSTRPLCAGTASPRGSGAKTMPGRPVSRVPADPAAVPACVAHRSRADWEVPANHGPLNT